MFVNCASRVAAIAASVNRNRAIKMIFLFLITCILENMTEK